MKGFSNTDLQLLIKLTQDETQTLDVEMQSEICQRDATTNRPVLGLILLSVKSIEETQVTLSNQEFSTLLSQVIHEISHILVFNVNSLTKPATSAPQAISESAAVGVTQAIYPFTPTGTKVVPNAITTDAVLAWAKNYFSCSTLTSFPIEVDTNTYRFTWNRAVFLDDVNSGKFMEGEQYWSGLNNALLIDSGWYTVVSNMYDNRIQYGRARGCLFLSHGCTGSNYFPEFCLSSGSKGLNLSKTSQATCTALYTDKSSIKSQVQTHFQSCMHYKSISSRHCQNSNNANFSATNQKLVSEFNFVFSTSSRAFASTLTPFSYTSYDTIGCFEATCASDSSSITITFKDSEFICKSDGAFVSPTKSFDYTGRLSCPSSISKFCNSGKSCSNYCSQYGYCLNGNCTCIDSRSGSGCECSSGQVYKNGNCQVCETACKTCNESGTCEACEDGYYLSNSICTACSSTCKTCSANAPRAGETCESCDSGYFLEHSTKLCVACSANCETCSSESQCTKCNTGFGFDSTGMYCSIKCDYNCNTCLNSPLNCVQCSENFTVDSDGSCKCKYVGFYQDPDNNCKACAANCDQCENATECIECKEGYNLLKYQKVCQPNFAFHLTNTLTLLSLLILAFYL